MAKKRTRKRGEGSAPSSAGEALVEYERIRKKKPGEVAALERCWAQHRILASVFAELVAQGHDAEHIRIKFDRLGAPLTATQQEALWQPQFDAEQHARDLLGADADPAVIAFMASDLKDRAVVLFLDRRKAVTAVPYIYAYCRVLLGLGTLSARDHAIAELVLGRDVTLPKTVDDWEQRIDTWDKRLTSKELSLADVETSIRRWAAERGLRGKERA